jgi:hypothetical protein
VSPRELAAVEALLTRKVAEAEAKLQVRADARTDAQIKQIASKLESTTRGLASKIDTQINAALKRLESAGPGVSAEEIRALRQRLETIEGATSGASRVAPILSLIPNPAARLGVLAASIGLGALEGSTRVERRERAARAAAIEDDRGLDLDARFRDAEEALRRLDAARRRARRGAR